jgi:hypothetical protein
VVEQSNFYDYHVPRMREVPLMHIEVIQTDNHPTGAGQMATPAGSAGHCECGSGADSRAAAAHAVPAGSGEEGVGLESEKLEMMTGALRLARPSYFFRDGPAFLAGVRRIGWKYRKNNSNCQRICPTTAPLSAV